MVDRDSPQRLRKLLSGLHDLLIDDDANLLAYLVMMTPRLVALHRALKPTGSLYLHCDPTASHYLKLTLDAIFGTERFLNEIVWQRTVPKSLMTKRLPNNHDLILSYSKADDPTWNADAVFAPYEHDDLDEKTRVKYSSHDESGRRYQLTSLLNPNADRPNLTYEFMGVTRVWRWTQDRMRAALEAGQIVQTRPGSPPRFKRYLDEQRGKPLGDVWIDIPPVNSQAQERLGYPTQKPVALLDRILKLASKPNDLVLDPFCGCGTTIEACERLGRRWIGIDIARKAVEVTEQRFERLQLEPPEVKWHPTDLQAAAALAERDSKQFEEWSLRIVRAARRRKKDRGIDGEALFSQPDGGSWLVLVSVKGGRNLNPGMVRDLRGTVEREGAPIGVFVTMYEPSKEMRLEATRAGFLSQSDALGPIPKLQVLTVEQIFGGGTIRAPGSNVTQMPRPTVPPISAQLSLDLDRGPSAKLKAVSESQPPREAEAKGATAETPPIPAQTPAKTKRGNARELLKTKAPANDVSKASERPTPPPKGPKRAARE